MASKSSSKAVEETSGHITGKPPSAPDETSNPTSESTSSLGRSLTSHSYSRRLWHGRRHDSDQNSSKGEQESNRNQTNTSSDRVGHASFDASLATGASKATGSKQDVSNYPGSSFSKSMKSAHGGEARVPSSERRSSRTYMMSNPFQKLVSPRTSMVEEKGKPSTPSIGNHTRTTNPSDPSQSNISRTSSASSASSASFKSARSLLSQNALFTEIAPAGRSFAAESQVVSRRGGSLDNTFSVDSPSLRPTSTEKSVGSHDRKGRSPLFPQMKTSLTKIKPAAGNSASAESAGLSRAESATSMGSETLKSSQPDSGMSTSHQTSPSSQHPALGTNLTTKFSNWLGSWQSASSWQGASQAVAKPTSTEPLAADSAAIAATTTAGAPTPIHPTPLMTVSAASDAPLSMSSEIYSEPPSSKTRELKPISKLFGSKIEIPLSPQGNKTHEGTKQYMLKSGLHSMDTKDNAQPPDPTPAPKTEEDTKGSHEDSDSDSESLHGEGLDEDDGNGDELNRKLIGVAADPDAEREEWGDDFLLDDDAKWDELKPSASLAIPTGVSSPARLGFADEKSPQSSINLDAVLEHSLYSSSAPHVALTEARAGSMIDRSKTLQSNLSSVGSMKKAYGPFSGIREEALRILGRSSRLLEAITGKSFAYSGQEPTESAMLSSLKPEAGKFDEEIWQRLGIWEVGSEIFRVGEASMTKLLRIVESSSDDGELLTYSCSLHPYGALCPRHQADPAGMTGSGQPAESPAWNDLDSSDDEITQQSQNMDRKGESNAGHPAGLLDLGIRAFSRQSSSNIGKGSKDESSSAMGDRTRSKQLTRLQILNCVDREHFVSILEDPDALSSRSRSVIEDILYSKIKSAEFVVSRCFGLPALGPMQLFSPGHGLVALSIGRHSSYLRKLGLREESVNRMWNAVAESLKSCTCVKLNDGKNLAYDHSENDCRWTCRTDVVSAILLLTEYGCLLAETFIAEDEKKAMDVWSVALAMIQHCVPCSTFPFHGLAAERAEVRSMNAQLDEIFRSHENASWRDNTSLFEGDLPAIGAYTALSRPCIASRIMDARLRRLIAGIHKKGQNLDLAFLHLGVLLRNTLQAVEAIDSVSDVTILAVAPFSPLRTVTCMLGLVDTAISLGALDFALILATWAFWLSSALRNARFVSESQSNIDVIRDLQGFRHEFQTGKPRAAIIQELLKKRKAEEEKGNLPTEQVADVVEDWDAEIEKALNVKIHRCVSELGEERSAESRMHGGSGTDSNPEMKRNTVVPAGTRSNRGILIRLRPLELEARRAIGALVSSSRSKSGLYSSYPSVTEPMDVPEAVVQDIRTPEQFVVWLSSFVDSTFSIQNEFDFEARGRITAQREDHSSFVSFELGKDAKDHVRSVEMDVVADGTDSNVDSSNVAGSSQKRRSISVSEGPRRRAGSKNRKQEVKPMAVTGEPIYDPLRSYFHQSEYVEKPSQAWACLLLKAVLELSHSEQTELLGQSSMLRALLMSYFKSVSSYIQNIPVLDRKGMELRDDLLRFNVLVILHAISSVLRGMDIDPPSFTEMVTLCAACGYPNLFANFLHQDQLLLADADASESCQAILRSQLGTVMAMSYRISSLGFAFDAEAALGRLPFNVNGFSAQYIDELVKYLRGLADEGLSNHSALASAKRQALKTKIRGMLVPNEPSTFRKIIGSCSHARKILDDFISICEIQEGCALSRKIAGPENNKDNDHDDVFACRTQRFKNLFDNLDKWDRQKDDPMSFLSSFPHLDDFVTRSNAWKYVVKQSKPYSPVVCYAMRLASLYLVSVNLSPGDVKTTIDTEKSEIDFHAFRKKNLMALIRGELSKNENASNYKPHSGDGVSEMDAELMLQIINAERLRTDARSTDAHPPLRVLPSIADTQFSRNQSAHSVKDRGHSRSRSHSMTAVGALARSRSRSHSAIGYRSPGNEVSSPTSEGHRQRSSYDEVLNWLESEMDKIAEQEMEALRILTSDVDLAALCGQLWILYHWLDYKDLAKARIAFVLAHYERYLCHNSEKSEQLLLDALCVVSIKNVDLLPNTAYSTYMRNAILRRNVFSESVLFAYGEVAVLNGKYEYAIAAFQAAIDAQKARSGYDRTNWLELGTLIATIASSKSDWRRSISILSSLQGEVLPKDGKRNDFISYCTALCAVCTNAGCFVAAETPLLAIKALLYEESWSSASVGCPANDRIRKEFEVEMDSGSSMSKDSGPNSQNAAGGYGNLAGRDGADNSSFVLDVDHTTVELLEAQLMKSAGRLDACERILSSLLRQQLPFGLRIQVLELCASLKLARGEYVLCANYCDEVEKEQAILDDYSKKIQERFLFFTGRRVRKSAPMAKTGSRSGRLESSSKAEPGVLKGSVIPSIMDRSKSIAKAFSKVPSSLYEFRSDDEVASQPEPVFFDESHNRHDAILASMELSELESSSAWLDGVPIPMDQVSFAPTHVSSIYSEPPQTSDLEPLHYRRTERRGSGVESVAFASVSQDLEFEGAAYIAGTNHQSQDRVATDGNNIISADSEQSPSAGLRSEEPVPDIKFLKVRALIRDSKYCQAMQVISDQLKRLGETHIQDRAKCYYYRGRVLYQLAHSTTPEVFFHQSNCIHGLDHCPFNMYGDVDAFYELKPSDHEQVAFLVARALNSFKIASHLFSLVGNELGATKARLYWLKMGLNWLTDQVIMKLSVCYRSNETSSTWEARTSDHTELSEACTLIKFESPLRSLKFDVEFDRGFGQSSATLFGDRYIINMKEVDDTCCSLLHWHSTVVCDPLLVLESLLCITELRFLQSFSGEPPYTLLNPAEMPDFWKDEYRGESTAHCRRESTDGGISGPKTDRLDTTKPPRTGSGEPRLKRGDSSIQIVWYEWLLLAWNIVRKLFVRPPSFHILIMPHASIGTLNKLRSLFGRMCRLFLFDDSSEKKTTVSMHIQAFEVFTTLGVDITRRSNLAEPIHYNLSEFVAAGDSDYKELFAGFGSTDRSHSGGTAAAQVSLLDKMQNVWNSNLQANMQRRNSMQRSANHDNMGTGAIMSFLGKEGLDLGKAGYTLMIARPQRTLVAAIRTRASILMADNPIQINMLLRRSTDEEGGSDDLFGIGAVSLLWDTTFGLGKTVKRLKERASDFQEDDLIEKGFMPLEHVVWALYYRLKTERKRFLNGDVSLEEFRQRSHNVVTLWTRTVHESIPVQGLINTLQSLKTQSNRETLSAINLELEMEALKSSAGKVVQSKYIPEAVRKHLLFVLHVEGMLGYYSVANRGCIRKFAFSGKRSVLGMSKIGMQQTTVDAGDKKKAGPRHKRAESKASSKSGRRTSSTNSSSEGRARGPHEVYIQSVAVFCRDEVVTPSCTRLRYCKPSAPFSTDSDIDLSRDTTRMFDNTSVIRNFSGLVRPPRPDELSLLYSLMLGPQASSSILNRAIYGNEERNDRHGLYSETMEETNSSSITLESLQQQRILQLQQHLNQRLGSEDSLIETAANRIDSKNRKESSASALLETEDPLVSAWSLNFDQKPIAPVQKLPGKTMWEDARRLLREIESHVLLVPRKLFFYNTRSNNEEIGHQIPADDRGKKKYAAVALPITSERVIVITDVSLFGIPWELFMDHTVSRALTLDTYRIKRKSVLLAQAATSEDALPSGKRESEPANAGVVKRERAFSGYQDSPSKAAVPVMIRRSTFGAMPRGNSRPGSGSLPGANALDGRSSGLPGYMPVEDSRTMTIASKRHRLFQCVSFKQRMDLASYLYERCEGSAFRQIVSMRFECPRDLYMMFNTSAVRNMRLLGGATELNASVLPTGPLSSPLPLERTTWSSVVDSVKKQGARMSSTLSPISSGDFDEIANSTAMGSGGFDGASGIYGNQGDRGDRGDYRKSTTRFNLPSRAHSNFDWKQLMTESGKTVQTGFQKMVVRQKQRIPRKELKVRSIIMTGLDVAYCDDLRAALNEDVVANEAFVNVVLLTFTDLTEVKRSVFDLLNCNRGYDPLITASSHVSPNANIVLVFAPSLQLHIVSKALQDWELRENVRAEFETSNNIKRAMRIMVRELSKFGRERLIPIAVFMGDDL